ncbi:HET-domain-containing protein [Colletotrichum scovillei]|uniref:HET-domain-containing protein n=1 Tax=Colletotrichum scovillei TaxID=1209932 RepID=A0A9P7QTR9_9PEZI|nr:HET-domain-containing protein [Colletotrichum scovillei]
MGYSHYYDVKDWNSPQWRKVWPRFIEDSLLIMEASDVRLIETEPCHDYDLEATSPPVCTVERGINFNGLGDAGHEPFFLCEQEPCQVKTNRKPYDLTISCILLRAFALCPKNIKISSDGYWNEYIWENARELYRSLWPSECIHCPWGNETDDSNEDEFEREWRKKHLTLPPKKASKKKSQSRAIRQSRLKLRTGMRSIRASPMSGVSMVRFDAIRDKISHCATSYEHQKCCPDSLRWRNFPGIRFRLIDVRRKCVVDAPDDLPFAVLSYVWGSVDQVKLTSENVRELSRPQGLDSVWSHIPTTVRDAMMVCERLGEAYLWVDALCILQDSARDRKVQILRMRSIYSAAKFTIVAVSARHADEGFQVQRSAAVSPECNSIDDLDTFLAESSWGSRGWCYQEQVLSHRAVFFTSKGIFFQCQKATYHLDGTVLPKTSYTSSTLSGNQFHGLGSLLHIPQGKSLECFLAAVEAYSKRSFTYAKDKISAFQGVFHRQEGVMDGKRSMFHFGLPTCAFDQTFCWRTAEHNPHLRNPNFPSWSWLGWDDAVSFDRDLIRIARTSQILGGDRPRDLRNRSTTHPIYQLRQPVPWPSEFSASDGFGFPTNILGTGMFIDHGWPSMSITTSSAYLRISARPQQTRNRNGLYAVFPTICSQSNATQRANLSGHHEVASFDTTTHQAGQQYVSYDIRDHDRHRECEAETPLGHIWLDLNWRDSQPDLRVMKFIALGGHLEFEGSGNWQITMLMCLLEAGPESHYERFQIMDCSIQQSYWLKISGS